MEKQQKENERLEKLKEIEKQRLEKEEARRLVEEEKKKLEEREQVKREKQKQLFGSFFKSPGLASTSTEVFDAEILELLPNGQTKPLLDEVSRIEAHCRVAMVF